MSLNAVAGNVTMNTYSAFQLGHGVFVLAPILGVLFWLTAAYVLIYKRDLLGKLLLGYFILGTTALMLFVGYVVLMSMPALLGTLFEFIIGYFKLMYWFFFGTGYVLTKIPYELYAVLLATLPFAWYVGDRLQKHYFKKSKRKWKTMIS